MGKKWLDGLDQGQLGFQEGNDLVRIQGVRGQVDDRSCEAFGHREFSGLKPPALQTGLNRMQGGTEPVAQGDPGLFGRRLEGWTIVDPQGIFQEAVVWKELPGHMVLALPFQEIGVDPGILLPQGQQLIQMVQDPQSLNWLRLLLRINPVFQVQANDSFKFFGIVSNQRQVSRSGKTCYKKIIRSD